MHINTEKSNVNAKKRFLLREVMQNNDYRARLRMGIVNLYLDIMSGEKIDSNTLARSFGFSTRSIDNWTKAVLEDDYDSLYDKKIPGRPPSLDDHQLDEIKKAILDSPLNYGFWRWDGKSASAYIYEKYGVLLTPRECQNLFHKMGLSLIRPSIIPARASSFHSQREFYKFKISEIASDPNNIIVFQDEISIKLWTKVSSIWAEIGSRPTVESYADTTNILISGFAVLNTGTFIYDTPASFTTETTVTSIRHFLECFPVENEKRIFLIMDNAPWHVKAKRIIKENENDLFGDIKPKVTFVYIPPYSPDLNPIEQFWRYTRHQATDNVFFKNKEDLEERLFQFFSSFASGSEELKSLLDFEYSYDQKYVNNELKKIKNKKNANNHTDENNTTTQESAILDTQDTSNVASGTQVDQEIVMSQEESDKQILQLIIDNENDTGGIQINPSAKRGVPKGTKRGMYNKNGALRKKPGPKPRAENGSESAPEENSTPQGASTTETRSAAQQEPENAQSTTAPEASSGADQRESEQSRVPSPSQSPTGNENPPKKRGVPVGTKRPPINKDGSPRKKPGPKPRAENGSESAPEENSTPQGASTTETGGILPNNWCLEFL